MTETDIAYLLDRLDQIQALLMFFAIVVLGVIVYKFLRMFF